MTKYIHIFLLLCLLPLQAGRAQTSPKKGIVWGRPAGVPHTESQLLAMKEAGVEAVRTGIIRDHGILTLADTLQIDLYVDLPFEYLPSARLADTLEYAAGVLDTLVGLAQIHSSIRNIGLARYADTSDSTACAYFNRLAADARRKAPAGTNVYFVTRFIDDDVCADRVDFVLAEVLDLDDPAAPLRRWSAARPSGPNIGVAATGTWLRADSLRGLNVRGSPERQARYFETHLPVLLSDTLSAEPPVVFVYRWMDEARRYEGVADELERLFVERYGLHALDGTARPAMDVVAGVYTGRQTVFAFAQGDRVPERAPWTTLLGWGVMVMIGIFYATSPRFRHMVPRYFQAHFFFREAVREGRDVLLGASTVLLVSLAAAAGLITYVVLDAVRRMDVFSMAFRWLPETTQGAFVSLFSRPLVLILLAGCLYVIGLLGWTIVLSLLSRRRYRVAPSQALMLVVWPRWPLMLVMIAAMVIAAIPGSNLQATIAMAGAWLLLSLGAAVRTLLDLVAIARIPPYLLLPAVLLHPGILVLGAIVIALIPAGPELAYLWHAITRS